MNSNPWLLFGMYTSTDYRVCRELWHEISSLVGQGIPTLVMGDFNCIDSPQEKMGGRPFVDGVESREFHSFIKENCLVDLGFVGPRFT